MATPTTVNKSNKKAVRKTAAPSRKKGRPARLSRELILNAALELLKTTDAKDLTLTAIAKSLRTVPMSLYNHVRDMNDIMEGVSELVLAGLPTLDDIEGRDWREILRQWMSNLYAHLSEFPQAIKIFAHNNQVSSAWMGALSPVIRTFRNEGLDGAELVMAVSWVAESCASIVLIQSAASIEKQRVNFDSLHSLREKDQHEVFYFMSQQKDLTPEKYMAFIQQCMIDSLSPIINKKRKKA